ncbi:MAG: putative ABC-type transport system, permease component [Chloroflexi bacterium]|jgi:ABC-2 type transport system permease protein|nr:putative ABC-type transport system, permease component [Chloroflexota bacterium]
MSIVEKSMATGAQTSALPGTMRTIWLIAKRAALESLRDRTTLWISIFFAVVLPVAIVMALIRPAALDATTLKKEHAFGALLAVYFLVVGLGPSSSSMSIASGVFAGEKEKGNLAPLLATPASNAAIFGGKVLGAVLPALLYAAIAEAIYLALAIATAGANMLQFLPLALAISMLALVPAVAVLGATVASLFSSRVRTYSAAQMATNLAMLPVMAVLFGLAFQMRDWGSPALYIAVFIVFAIDALLLRLGSSTWRREEVMATQ